MDFITAIKTCLGKYATFQGRAIRSEYWYFTLFNLILNLMASVIAGASLGALTVLPVIVLIALLVPSIAVSIRRLHDLDKSGWWVLLALIPLIGAIILLIWSIKRGTVGLNRFGADPLPEAIGQLNAA